MELLWVQLGVGPQVLAGKLVASLGLILERALYLSRSYLGKSTVLVQVLVQL